MNRAGRPRRIGYSPQGFTFFGVCLGSVRKGLTSESSSVAEPGIWHRMLQVSHGSVSHQVAVRPSLERGEFPALGAPHFSQEPQRNSSPRMYVSGWLANVDIAWML